jgi:hypothetical protein
MKSINLILACCCFLQFSQAQPKKVTTPKQIAKPTVKKPIEIVWEEPNVIDLFGNEPNIQTPNIPNSGLEVGKEIPLTGTFTFNKKIGFMVNSPEGDMVSYFYLNTKNGYSMLDWNGLKAMANEAAEEGEMNQIFSPNADFYQYVKSSEGNYAMKMGSGQSMVLHDMQTADASKQFFKTFKKTGKKVGKEGGNKIPRVEYEGIYEGKKMSIWLSSAQDILIDKRFTSALTGYFGLGYIASPTGKTYLMSGFQGDGANIFITYIENCSKTFSGKGYKPIGDMMVQAMENMPNATAENYSQMQAEINNEKDPKLRAIKIEALKKAKNRDKKTKSQAEIFAQTSDLQDMPYVNQLNDPKTTADYYDILII